MKQLIGIRKIYDEKMIHILHVFNNLNRGGAETLIMNVYRSIDRSKVQFDFAVHSALPQDYIEEIEELGGKVYVFPAFKGVNWLHYKRVWKRFLIENNQYQAIHSHIRSYSFIYLKEAKKKEIITIAHGHSTSNGFGVKSFVKNVMQHNIRKYADYYLGCSIESGEWLFGSKIVNSEKFSIFKNSINIKDFIYNQNTRNYFRNNLSINSKVAMVNVGRFTNCKNQKFLIDVLYKLLMIDNKYCLILVGDGKLKPKIKKYVHKLKLDEYVFFLGKIKNVADILSASDIFVMPSKWEGFPLSIIEAQVSQLPCIVSDNITKSTNVSGKVFFLPIKNGANQWVDLITKIALIARTNGSVFINGSFDALDNSKWLYEYYTKIIKK